MAKCDCCLHGDRHSEVQWDKLPHPKSSFSQAHHQHLWFFVTSDKVVDDEQFLNSFVVEDKYHVL